MRRSGNAVFGNAVIGLAVLGNAVALSCAPATRYQPPSGLRGYEILITRRDSLGEGLVRGLRRRGFAVRQVVRGGSRPTAYLLIFTFHQTEPPAVTWLHMRLADTRTGAILRVVSAPLDSLGPTAADQAGALVDSIAASPP
jgi:hypothetical protein